jgi:Co/Zn/Cd efflux system component
MADCCDDVCSPGQTGAGPKGIGSGSRQSRALAWVLVINLVLFVVSVWAALRAGSSSLLSGSIDNLGDAVTYGFSLYAVSRGARTKAKVSFFKGILILTAAVAVSVQVIYKLVNPGVPVFELMGAMSLLGLGANFACLLILWRHRDEDINMASVWECSRNDVLENLAVLAAAAGVWMTRSQWPDTVVALVLVTILYRSAFRIIRRSRAALDSVV